MQPDDPVWEARIAAVMTLQIYAGTARRDLFGQEPGVPEDERVEYDEPVPTLDGAEEIRQALDDIDAALDAARKHLRELPR